MEKQFMNEYGSVSDVATKWGIPDTTIEKLSDLLS